MAQIIKHRRGSIGALKDVTANVGELVIATGSIGDLNAPVVFVGSAATAGGYKAVSKIYRGSTAPTLGSDYGTVMDGTPFYSSNSKTFYILDKDGNITMDLSGNLEGNTISGITINNITGSRATFDTFVSSSALNVTGNTQMGGTLNVNGSTTINNNLTVTGTTSVSGTTNLGSSLNVTGATTLYSATTINAGLTVTGNTNVNSALNVTGATTLYSATTINAGLTVTGTTNANGGLNVTGSVNISGATSVTGALNVSENTTFQKDLYVSGNIYQTGSFYTQGDIVLSGSINIGNSLTGDTINFGGEVNSHIIPTTNNTYDLGTSAKAWKDLYVSGTAYIDQLNLGSIQLTNLDLPGYLNVTGATTLYSATTINADLTVTGSTTLSGSVLVEDLTEKRLVVVGLDGLLTDYTGLTFDNGNLNVSGAIEVTNIQGTGSLYLKPDLNDSRLFEIYNSAGPSGYTDIHFVGNADLNYFGDDTNYLKIDDNAQTVSIVGVNGVFVSSSLKVTGSVNVSGSTSITGAFTVASGSMTSLGGDLYVSGNLQVLGSATEVHLQSQTIELDDNIIRLNAYSPFQRYAGFEVIDSGSTGESGSMVWDSQNDYWMFVSSSGQSSKFVGTTAGTYGSETSLTSGTFPIANASNTIGDSLLTYSGTTLAFNTNKFTIDSSNGNTLVYGSVTLSYSGGTDSGSYSSYVVFRNDNDVLGFVGSNDTTNVTDRLLGYNSTTGVLEFSSLIDGGTY
jgi:cytoskeletal protein CcmA (bactofilin family)